MSDKADTGQVGTLFTPSAWPERIGLLVSKVAVCLIVVLVMLEILCRKLLNFSLGDVEEISSYLLVGLFFLSLAGCQTTNSFHHVELVQDRLSIRARIASQLLFNAIALLSCAILLWFLIRFESLSFQRGDRSMSDLTQLWIPRIIMPIGIALLCYAIAKTILRIIARASGR